MQAHIQGHIIVAVTNMQTLKRFCYLVLILDHDDSASNYSSKL